MDVGSGSRRRTQSIVIIDRLTAKWVASVRETRHQLREAGASMGDGRRWMRFCVGIEGGGGGGGVGFSETRRRCSDSRGQVVEQERQADLPGLRWQRHGSQWTPNAESISQ